MNHRLNDLERYLLGKLTETESFKKLSRELALELLATGQVRPKTDQEIDAICSQMYDELVKLDKSEKTNKLDA